MSNTYLLIVFAGAIIISYNLSQLVKWAALSLGIVDNPAVSERKIHKNTTPLLGGIAIFVTFFTVLFFNKNLLLSGDLEIEHWLGFFIGSFILIIGGVLDDKYNLSPARQLIFPVLATTAVIIGGVEIEKITNPFGGVLQLSGLFSGVVIAIWIIGMTYTTKILDGLDGLVSGVSAIGGLIIFFFTMSSRYYQPDIAFASLVLSGAAIGFLILNWHPAKIFLGEGGSLFLGFALGVLSIISGGKLAIALAIMIVPILDVAWSIIRRAYGGKNPFKSSDRKHLHHRLLDFGLSQRQVSAVFYFMAFFFGLMAVFLQSAGKVLLLIFLVVIISGIFYFLNSFKVHS